MIDIRYFLAKQKARKNAAPEPPKKEKEESTSSAIDEVTSPQHTEPAEVQENSIQQGG